MDELATELSVPKATVYRWNSDGTGPRQGFEPGGTSATATPTWIVGSTGRWYPATGSPDGLRCTSAERRRLERLALRDLRRAGCRCIPHITVFPAAELINGASGGGYVEHEKGCPFGDAMNRLGRATGRLPEVWFSVPADLHPPTDEEVAS